MVLPGNGSGSTALSGLKCTCLSGYACLGSLLIFRICQLFSRNSARSLCRFVLLPSFIIGARAVWKGPSCLRYSLVSPHTRLSYRTQTLADTTLLFLSLGSPKPWPFFHASQSSLRLPSLQTHSRVRSYPRIHSARPRRARSERNCLERALRGPSRRASARSSSRRAICRFLLFRLGWPPIWPYVSPRASSECRSQRRRKRSE